MIHRGPHGEWHHLEPGAGLALRSLCKSNPFNRETGKSENESIIAILDGVIYNQAELQANLQAKGHTFRTSSDAEVIAHLYEQERDKFPEFLNGIFSIAVWDRSHRRLLLVRDRLGVKPLYFAKLNGTLIFASELKAVIRHPEINREIDLMGFSEYLTFGHAIPQRTVLSGVKKLQPGHMIVYEHAKISMRQYWDLRFPDKSRDTLDEKEHVERFREAFLTSVKRTLTGGAPVGALLSGGMDTSSIVAMMSHLGVQEIHTYCAGYKESDVYDIRCKHIGRANLVATHFHTCHHELAVSSQDYLEALPRFILYMDDPVADAASLLRMLLAGLARENVSVLLGGEAGDDVMGGYHFGDSIARFDRLRRFQSLPRWLRCSLPALLSPFLPERTRAWLARGNRNIAALNADEHASMVWSFEAEEKRRYCPVLREVHDHCHNLAREVYARSNTEDPLSQLTYFFLKIWAAESMMMSADKMLASQSIEYRPPFLDHELVELSAGTPSHFKIRRERNGTYTIKNILKQTMRGILPDEVIKDSKKPFHVPTVEWFGGAMAGYCRDVLLSHSARSSGYYDSKQVQMLLESHQRSSTVITMQQIRNLLFFEMWRQLVLTPRTYTLDQWKQNWKE
jgi:asparagine synthase (glutamine-hydrolysing)